MFRVQGTTNFLVDFREALLSLTDFREALLEWLAKQARLVLQVMACSTMLGTCTGPIAERSKSSDLDCGRGPGFKSRQE